MSAPATPETEAANAAAAYALAASGEEALADKGFLAVLPGGTVTAGDRLVRDNGRWSFLNGEAPATVHPGLWRHAGLNTRAGLYEVVPGRIWQVRGLDLANLTLIAGATGWIVLDTLTNAESAAAALALANGHLGERDVQAVVITHSHIDHFGGIRGVLPEGREVPVVAPEGFLDAAVEENIAAGNAMFRRAGYMFGAFLPASPRGQVDHGLGKSTGGAGTSGLVAPTVEIGETGTELVLDGVRIVFQVTPGTEAPAELNLYLPDDRALCVAENAVATLHNLYTPRGAEIRDGLAWSKYLHETLLLYGGEAEVLFASHQWPRWGAEAVVEFLTLQRDAYRYLHDQTLRLANHGLGPVEIAEELEFPESLARKPFLRGYYGTVNHNVKAVYQRYLGWFDGNPANLHPLPPVESAKRSVAYMGGAEAVLAKAREDFAKGEYRWVAEVVNQVVFAEPDNEDARELQAAALEQLGYQAESAAWRNIYLTGALELRDGIAPVPRRLVSPDLLRGMSPEQVFDFVAVRLKGHEATGIAFSVNWVLPEATYVTELSNGSLHTAAGVLDPEAHATVTLDRETLTGLLLRPEEVFATLQVEGDATVLPRLFALLDRFEPGFPIVTP
ncbi:alkyl/aryl-sulfatase [Glycomyces sp. NPDC048151]|uniref:alkyl/aryl-sulfatase n=1 Tax=Glycomyces sp. NPDC048151 TaxID=3364002 RepID=UPI0037225AD2